MSHSHRAIRRYFGGHLSWLLILASPFVAALTLLLAGRFAPGLSRAPVSSASDSGAGRAGLATVCGERFVISGPRPDRPEIGSFLYDDRTKELLLIKVTRYQNGRGSALILSDGKSYRLDCSTGSISRVSADPE